MTNFFMSYRVQTIIFKYGRHYEFGLQYIRSELLDVIHCLKINIENMQKYKCREQIFKCQMLTLMMFHKSSFSGFGTFRQSKYVIGTISLASTPSNEVSVTKFGPIGWFLSLIWISSFSSKLLISAHLVGPLHFFLIVLVDACVEGSTPSIIISWWHDCLWTYSVREGHVNVLWIDY